MIFGRLEFNIVELFNYGIKLDIIKKEYYVKNVGGIKKYVKKIVI